MTTYFMLTRLLILEHTSLSCSIYGAHLDRRQAYPRIDVDNVSPPNV